MVGYDSFVILNEECQAKKCSFLEGARADLVVMWKVMHGPMGGKWREEGGGTKVDNKEQLLLTNLRQER